MGFYNSPNTPLSQPPHPALPATPSQAGLRLEPPCSRPPSRGANPSESPPPNCRDSARSLPAPVLQAEVLTLLRARQLAGSRTPLLHPRSTSLSNETTLPKAGWSSHSLSALPPPQRCHTSGGGGAMRTVTVFVHTASSLSHLILMIPGAKHHTCKCPYCTERKQATQRSLGHYLAQTGFINPSVLQKGKGRT